MTHPSRPESTDRWGDRLPRRLGLWSAVAVLVGSTIGGGIFRTPAVIAGRVPEPVLMLVVWVLGGLLALCGALTYAELAAMFPRSGGVYVYVREGFGRLPAFLFGWSELLLIRASALGAIATPFAEYLLRSLGLDPTRPPYDGAVHWVAALAIVLTATLNYVGVRWSALLLNVTTAAKYAALALLVLLAFVVGQGSFGHFTEAGGGGPVRGGLFGLALVSVMWAYDGWGDLSFVGGEVKDPERSLPRALIVGTGAVVAIYLLVNAAYLYLIPIGAMAQSPLVAADAAQAILGRLGVGLVAIVVMVATFSTLLGSMLTAPHFLRDGGRRAVLPACGPCAPHVPHSFGGDRPDGRAGDRVRRVPDVPAARRPVRGRDLPVLRARGGGGVRTAAAPPAGPGAACGAGTRLSRGAGAVRPGDAVHARQRGVAGPAPHRARVPDHSRRRARVPGVAAPITRGLGVTRT